MMQQSGVVPPQMPPMSIDPQQQQQQYQQHAPMNQQQWMMMQAQAQAQQQHQSQAAAMQPSQLWPPQAPVQYSPASSVSDEIRSLWIGDLQPWMDEPYINTCFFNTGEECAVAGGECDESDGSDARDFICWIGSGLVGSGKICGLIS